MHQHDLLSAAHRFKVPVEHLDYYRDLASDDGGMAVSCQDSDGDLQLPRRYKGLRCIQHLLTDLTKHSIELTTDDNAGSDARSGTAEQNSPASYGPVAMAW